MTTRQRVAAVVLTVLLGAAAPRTSSARDIVGAINVDQYTLDKIVATHTTLVRFDRMHAYGEQEDVFKDLALRLGELETPNDFILSYVGVQEFQEKLSLDMAERRFGVYKQDWPVYKLFLKGQPDTPISYTGEIEVEALLRFLNERSGLRLPLRGCLVEFDELAHQFMAAQTPGERGAIKDRAVAEAAAAPPSAATSAGWYTKAMDKVLESGDDYIDTEMARIQRLIDETELSPAKKTQFKLRINVLTAFSAAAAGGAARDEL